MNQNEELKRQMNYILEKLLQRISVQKNLNFMLFYFI